MQDLRNTRQPCVGADAFGAKASTKHFESRLEVTQGHAFWDH